MTETVVHVTTLEQWKSVLDVWFEQGHKWNSNSKDSQQGRFKNYYYEAFRDGCRQLAVSDNKSIYFYGKNGYKGETIEYSEFIAQQKEDNKMETYYVTQEQFDWIKELKSLPAPLVAIMNKKYGIETLYNELPLNDIEWFSYLSGVIKIEFKVKEQLYRLCRIDEDGDMVYMKFSYGTPDWTTNKDVAFTALLEEIKKWKTPAWNIEEVQ